MTSSNLQIMGIVNLTPDSFSDGGEVTKTSSTNKELFLEKCKNLINQGCNIIDIGAEASGPNSIDISLDEELNRLAPAIEVIKEHNLDKLVEFSIDTYKAKVADYCLSNGFTIVNDITGLRGDPKMASVVAQHQAKIVLMFSKDPSTRTTKTAKDYPDIMATIINFFKKQIPVALSAGIKKENIIIDPGMGAFLSTIPQYSFQVLKRLKELTSLKFPILIGTSRKSFLGGQISDRDIPSLLTDCIALYNGAQIIRTHNPVHHKQLIEIINQLTCKSS